LLALLLAAGVVGSIACLGGEDSASPSPTESPSTALTPRPRQTATPDIPGGSPTPDGSATPGETAVEGEFVVALDPAVPQSVVTDIRSWLAEHATGADLSVTSTRNTDDADISITALGTAGGVEVAPTYWIALANVTSAVDDITSDFVAEAVAGDADWSSVEFGAAGPVSLYVAEGEEAALASVLGVSDEEIQASATVLPIEELRETILGDASALAILPLAEVDTRGRSLAVDGVDVVREIGDPGDYPFVSSYYAASNPGSKNPDLARDVVAYLGSRPSPLHPNIHVLAVGDIIPARCVLARILAAGPDYNLPWYEVRDKISEADLAFATLDMQLADGVQHQLCVENYVHTGPTALAEGFAWAGFDLIMNGTNHSMDGRIAKGPEAVTENRRAMEDAGLVMIGQGENLAQARKPAVIEVKGVKFGFTSADGVASYTWATADSPGTNPADPDDMAKQVLQLKNRADVVIATCECGIVDGDAEYRRLPTDLQLEMAAAAFEAGATEYIGGQSHWVQGADFLGPKFAGYHMGNFVYDQDWSYETMHGAILDSYYIGSRLVNVRYSIVVIDNMCCPRIVDANEAQVTLAEVWKATPKVPGTEVFE
jgi:poly-gamma-glutamate synthesis protein (capsule biosynthesis protein)